MVKNPLANTGDAGSIPGLEDHLEEQMATHSSILAWEIPEKRNLEGYSHGVANESDSFKSWFLHLELCDLGQAA